MSSVQQATTTAAGFGGLLWAMVSVFTIVGGPTAADARTLRRAIVEAVMSIVAALIGGYYVAPWICLWRHITQTETVSLTGLFVGMVFWKLVPVLSSVLVDRTTNWLKKAPVQ